MIKTWMADITPLYDSGRFGEYYRRAPQFRRDKADRLKSPQAKAQSIGVWALYEQMKKEYGIKDKAAHNFSHSGKYVLCSIALNAEGGVKVGCDIQKIRGCNLNLAARFFCQSEYESIVRERGEEKRAELFCRYWVLKESFMKATGRGLALGLDSFEVLPGDPPVLVRQPEEFSEPYYYMEAETGDRAYRAAVCSTDREIDLEIQKGFQL